MPSPYSEAQLLGRFCNFLMKSPNFGTPYYTVYTLHYTLFGIHDAVYGQYFIPCIYSRRKRVGDISTPDNSTHDISAPGITQQILLYERGLKCPILIPKVDISTPDNSTPDNLNPHFNPPIKAYLPRLYCNG